jgi:hypothetical protein
MGSSPLISADGRWRWDGVSWVPIPVAPVAATPMRARWVALIVAGSLASLLLAGTGLAALSGAYSQLGSRFFSTGTATTCTPSNFPAYPGAATVTSLKAFSVCTTVSTTRDSSIDVLSYYQTELDKYPWRVTGGSAQQGTVDFARQDGVKGSGELSVAPSAGSTQIQVVYQT